MTPLHVIVLAAGQGQRMRSSLPKVLHLLAGRPLLSYVVAAANALGAERVHVVHGHGGGIVREAMAAADVDWVEQREQLGTGHAVALAMAGIPDDATVLVLYGDVPLVNRTTLHDTATLASDSGIALVTAVVADPSGYGRIVRGLDGQVRGIVEEGDADDGQRAIAEINTGILAAHAGRLRGWLQGLSSDNARGERYLTDVIAPRGRGRAVGAHRAAGGGRGRCSGSTTARSSRRWSGSSSDGLRRNSCATARASPTRPGSTSGAACVPGAMSSST